MLICRKLPAGGGEFLHPGMIKVEMCGGKPYNIRKREEGEPMDGPLECPAVEVDRGMLRLPRRPRDSHKGDYGRLFLLAGSRGYTGAPCLAARAAVRGGAGLLPLPQQQAVSDVGAA